MFLERLSLSPQEVGWFANRAADEASATYFSGDTVGCGVKIDFPTLLPHQPDR